MFNAPRALGGKREAARRLKRRQRRRINEIVEQVFIRAANDSDLHGIIGVAQGGGEEAIAVGMLPAIGAPAVRADPVDPIADPRRPFDIRLGSVTVQFQIMSQVDDLQRGTGLIPAVDPQLVGFVVRRHKQVCPCRGGSGGAATAGVKHGLGYSGQTCDPGGGCASLDQEREDQE